jgi:FAD/FMN-containing dehydrogenase
MRCGKCAKSRGWAGLGCGRLVIALEKVEPELGLHFGRSVALYRDSYSTYWGEPEERVASAAVTPVKVKELEHVVRTANNYRIPSYPFSRGRNFTYGGSAPTMRGTWFSI